MNQSNHLSYPASAVDAQQKTCQLLVPFVGYRVRFFNQLLEQLGEVSHFLLTAAAYAGLDLPKLLPKLGLTPVQMQTLLQRLQQLNLLDAQQHLTPEGHAAAEFLTQGWQGKTATLWLEQSYKQGRGRTQLLMLAEATQLNQRQHWPAAWPEQDLFQGRSSTQMQNQALQSWLKEHAKQLGQGDRQKQAHQAFFLRLFPEANAFLNRYPQWTLSYELEALTEEAPRYCIVNLPIPGQQQDVWQLTTHDAKPRVYLWPLVQAKVTYSPAIGLNTPAPVLASWVHHWCAHTGSDCEVDAAQLQPEPADLTHPAIWQQRLAAALPEESSAQRLMTRQITFSTQLTAWQLDEQGLRQRLEAVLQTALVQL